MKDDIDILIRRATPADAATVADLTRRAFQTQCELYEVDTLPPMEDTAETVLGAMTRGVVLVAEESGRIVGSVRGELEGTTCTVGRLVVEPTLHGHGIGRALTARIERHFPDAQRFELFTGNLSAAALHLYESLGYARESEQEINERVSLVFLGKAARDA